MIEQQPLPRSTRIIYAAFDFVRQYRKKRTLTVLAAIVVFLVGISGFYIVKKEEEGLRTRFGKVVATGIGPGVHYRIPIIEEVHIRKVKRILPHQIASKSGNTVNFTLLSGDTNLFEVDIVIQYKIDNLRNFLYASADPIALFTMLLRTELVNVMGQNFIDLILTSNRNIIQQRLLSKITSDLEDYDIGLEVVSLDIVNIRPIEETLAAFRDVNDAIAERIQAESIANTKREKLIAHSKGQAEALVKNAHAKAEERIVQAQSSANTFLALLAKYRNQPEQVAITRYWQRMRTIFAEASLSAVNPVQEATIDINMIDALVGGHTPVDMLLDATSAPSVDGQLVERPFLSLLTTRQKDTHTFENVDDDKNLFDGHFHNRRLERDHLNAANPRSLIFDMPSIFYHQHPPTRRQGALRQANEKSIAESRDEENTQDSKTKVKEKNESPQ